MEIAASILDIAKNGSRKTRIMYLGNLSFDLLLKYVDLLINLGLMQIVDGPEKTYITTEKGRQFLADFQELQKHAEAAEEKKQTLGRMLTSEA